MLQRGAVWCSVLQCESLHCPSQCVAAWCSVLQCVSALSFFFLLHGQSGSELTFEIFFCDKVAKGCGGSGGARSLESNGWGMVQVEFPQKKSQITAECNVEIECRADS